MIEIGLTGGIGSGKSTVAEMLVERGAVLLDADRIVRDLQAPGGSVFAAMVERWGERIIADDGTLDRQAVAAIVFNDADELEALNGIVHPAVAEELKTQREAVEGSDTIVVLDIPLLVRADGTSDKDRYANLAGIVVVDVDPGVALDRLVAQRGFDENDARARIANQASREQRRAVADVVIDNSGSLDALALQVDDVWSWARALPPAEASDSSGSSCTST
ncbi:MAG: dephospho-CoA kinase [Acidimicrobiales bacterium]